MPPQLETRRSFAEMETALSRILQNQFELRAFMDVWQFYNVTNPVQPRRYMWLCDTVTVCAPFENV